MVVFGRGKGEWWFASRGGVRWKLRGGVGGGGRGGGGVDPPCFHSTRNRLPGMLILTRIMLISVVQIRCGHALQSFTKRTWFASQELIPDIKKVSMTCRSCHGKGHTSRSRDCPKHENRRKKICELYPADANYCDGLDQALIAAWKYLC